MHELREFVVGKGKFACKKKLFVVGKNKFVVGIRVTKHEFLIFVRVKGLYAYGKFLTNNGKKQTYMVS